MNREKVMFKEIDVIQGIINRMGTNSFIVKGWVIMLTVGVIALDKINSDNYLGIVGVALGAIVLFWILDAYFLQQERLYRKLYQWVVKYRMTSDEHILDMNPNRLFRQEDCIICASFSKSIRPLYMLLSVLVSTYCYFSL